MLAYSGEVRDPEILNEMRHSLGLDQPMPVQYVVWLGQILQGNFGRSIRTHQQVGEAIIERLPATLELTGAALLFSVTTGLIVGTVSALHRNSALDLLATGVTIAGRLGAQLLSGPDADPAVFAGAAGVSARAAMRPRSTIPSRT